MRLLRLSERVLLSFQFATIYRLAALCALAASLSMISLFRASADNPAPPPNRAIQLDGSTGYVALAVGDVGIYSVNWTAEAWINTTAQPTDIQTFLGNSNGNDLRLYGGANARVIVSTYAGGFTNFFGSKRVNDGNWHQIVAVRSNDKLYLYIDGQADTDSQTGLPYRPAGTSPTNVNLKAVGNRGTPSEWFQGQVDDVRLYTRALTPGEIAAHYNNGSGIPAVPDTNLFVGLNFDEESGDAQDFSGNNRKGVLKNGATRVLRNGGLPSPQPTVQINNFTIAAAGQAPNASATIPLGQTVTFAWAMAYAQSASLPGTACIIAPLTSGSCQQTATQPGQFTFTLNAQGGGQSATKSVTLTVGDTPDTQPPTVSINPSVTGTTEQSAITISGTAADDYSIASLKFLTDRGQQGAVSGTSNWTATVPLLMGANVITVQVTDGANNSGSAQITMTRVSVTGPDTAPPQLNVTAPAQSSFPAGTQQVQVAVTTNENASCRISAPTTANAIFVSPNGNANNDGSMAHPIDLATAMSATSPARPGDTIWLKGGTYTLLNGVLTGTQVPVFRSLLMGTATAPITVRQYPGERATINGGIQVDGGYTIFRDFEITNLNPDRTTTRTNGLNVFGHHVKFINLIIHDNGDGVGFWQSAEDSEIYGLIIYRNGWDPPNASRGSGHGIYAQNHFGAKRIADVISFDNYATGMKAYTETGYVINVLFEGNISFNNGSSSRPRPDFDRIDNILAGSINNPCDRVTLRNNCTYHPLTTRGTSLRLGYLASGSTDLVVKDNYIAGGATALWRVSKWHNATVTGNTLIANDELIELGTQGQNTALYDWDNNKFFSRAQTPFNHVPDTTENFYDLPGWRQTTGLDANSQMLPAVNNRPTGVKVFVRPNQYEAGRANIAIYNWDLLNTVAVDVSTVLHIGDHYEVRNAQNFFGTPVLTGIYDGSALQLPQNGLMTGTPTGPEFNAFVLLVPSNAVPETDPPFQSMEPFAQTGGQSHTTVINTQDGQGYRRLIRCADNSGNVSPSSLIAFNVQSSTATPSDTQAPVVVINPPASLTSEQDSITLTGTATDNVAVTALSFSTNRGQQGTVTGLSSWSASIPLEIGENVITVLASDAANNPGSAQVRLTRTEVAPPPDTVPPVLTITAPVQNSFPPGTQQVQLGVSTNENSVCRYSPDANATFQTMTAFAQTGALIHSTSIATQNGGSYGLFVRCADAANNVSNAQSVSFSVQQPPPPPTGGANNAMQFDGFTGNLTLARGDSNVFTRFWTIETWLRTDSQRADLMTLIGNTSGSDLRMAGGLVILSFYNGAFSNFIGRRRINDGQWHHVVGVRDGDRMIVYIDGQIEYGQSDSGQLGYASVNSPGNANGFGVKSLGNRGTAHEWFQGLLDDVRLYSRALTAAEALAHFNNGQGIPSGTDADLLAGFDFNEINGNALDFSGNNRTGSLNGAAMRVAHNGGALPPPPPADTQSPTVVITPLAPLTTEQATITLSGTATDNTGVAAVSYQTDRGQQGQASGTNNWTATVPLLLGDNVITVRAQDAAGNIGSSQITITRTPPPPPPPDTQSPTVTINPPVSTATEQSTITLTGAANDNVGVTGISFQTDQGQQGQASGFSIWTAAIPLVLGSNLITIQARDAAGNIGSAQITIIRNAPPPPVPGGNNAVQFDGFAGNVAVASNDNGVATRFWTIETWVKTNSQRVDFMTLVGNNSGNDLRMAGGLMVLSMYNGVFTNFTGRRRINDGQWHQVVAVRDGDKLSLYIDGQVEIAQSDSTQQGFINVGAPGSNSSFKVRSLGNRGTDQEWYEGSMDDVRLYTRALAIAEVQAHFNNGLGIPAAPDSGLFVGFDFNEATGTALDFSGNNRHGQLRGTAARIVH